MTIFKNVLIGAVISLGACSTDATDIGDTTVGTQTFHIFREGPAATAGTSTTIVLKPTTGGRPDKIVGWVGIESAVGSEKVTSVYDSGDGDFDTDLTAPDPLPAGSKFWFEVTNGSDIETGSIDLK